MISWRRQQRTYLRQLPPMAECRHRDLSAAALWLTPALWTTIPSAHLCTAASIPSLPASSPHRHVNDLQVSAKRGTEIYYLHIRTFYADPVYYTLCLKNVPTYFLLFVSVKYKAISIKIGRPVLEDNLTKLCKKCPLHLKYVPWEIWEIWSDRQEPSTHYLLLIFFVVTSMWITFLACELGKVLLT